MSEATFQEYYEVTNKYPRISNGLLISTDRTVLIDDSWIGSDLPSQISVRVFKGGKLFQMWAGKGNNIQDFLKGKKRSRYVFPNGDTHVATIKYGDSGEVTLTKREKREGGTRWTDYYSSHVTVLTKEEWERVVEIAKVAIKKHDEYSQKVREKKNP